MPDITYIDKFITDGQLAPLGLSNFYDTILMVDNRNLDHYCRIPLYDIFLRYYNELSEAVVLYQMPKSFIYKPRLLSHELYGTIDMWMPIMRLNRLRNITEFNRLIIKVYEPGFFQELVEIFLKREDKI